MPWCGLLIDALALEVRPNLERILKNPLRCSVTVELTHPAQALQKAVFTFIRMKVHAIVLDSAINSKLTVIQNLSSLFLVAAMRTHAYVKKLDMFCRSVEDGFLFQCLLNGVTFCSNLVHSRTKHKVHKNLNFDDSVDKGVKGSTYPVSFFLFHHFIFIVGFRNEPFQSFVREVRIIKE